MSVKICFGLMLPVPIKYLRQIKLADMKALMSKRSIMLISEFELPIDDNVIQIMLAICPVHSAISTIIDKILFVFNAGNQFMTILLFEFLYDFIIPIAINKKAFTRVNTEIYG